MNTEELINSMVSSVLSFIGIAPSVKIEQTPEEVFNVNIEGNNLNFLIGFRGESLNAFQSLVGIMLIKKTGKPVILSLDINDYKSKKAERIHDMARGFIDKVRFFEKEVVMPPMTPWERRQVHVLVSEYGDIESESTGEGTARRVVLKPKIV